MKRHKQSRIGQGSGFGPLAVYYDVPVERGGILKVVMAATQWPPDSQTNIFVIGSNTINGSGIKEVAAEGSI